MKIQDILDLYDRAQNQGTNEFVEKEYDNVAEVGEYMNKMAENGKTIITDRLDEEKFVKVLNIMRATLLSSMAMGGTGKSLVISELSGDLKMYTDTVALSIIGMLADEEVI